MAENKLALTNKELNSVFLRSYQALGCYTYDKQQGIAYLRAMIPALEKLYPDHDDLVEAMKRHNTMFNTTCAFASLFNSITIRTLSFLSDSSLKSEIPSILL